jgi:hypothetical protein
VCVVLILGVLCRGKIKNWFCGARNPIHDEVPADRKTDYEMKNLE